jgi:hypothetical protein
MENRFDPWTFVVANVIGALLVWLMVFGFFGAIAAIVAPPRRRLRFFLLTLFFLGPLGIGFASIAPPVLPKVKDAWQYECERCGAWQNVPYDATSADCWRCGDEI